MRRDGHGDFVGDFVQRTWRPRDVRNTPLAHNEERLRQSFRPTTLPFAEAPEIWRVSRTTKPNTCVCLLESDDKIGAISSEKAAEFESSAIK